LHLVCAGEEFEIDVSLTERRARSVTGGVLMQAEEVEERL
jgi:hypothetical protein